MVDHLSPEKRSWNMSRVRSKDTGPEMKVRRLLFSMGFRYRINVKTLPGKPDIVLKKWNTVIFVHGCFWHRHKGCKDTTTPKTKTEWWLEKFKKNVTNDQKKRQALEELDWKVLVVWECETNQNDELLKERLYRRIVKNVY
ncbi:MAG: very short patch repair endonuclease [Deltaproteobacteria bacterium HGW-Deltaproteobacteria-6]|jgi:DNA mismatch endonuclease (patch repair protein)|nr:MAG: very short patch repair endonuclease [Deltaproteobacteria bacterium HGW-Deltaproteobacteria-6]